MIQWSPESEKNHENLPKKSPKVFLKVYSMGKVLGKIFRNVLGTIFGKMFVTNIVLSDIFYSFQLPCFMQHAVLSRERRDSQMEPDPVMVKKQSRTRSLVYRVIVLLKVIYQK